MKNNHQEVLEIHGGILETAAEDATKIYTACEECVSDLIRMNKQVKNFCYKLCTSEIHSAELVG